MLWQFVAHGAQILVALAGAYLVAFWFVLIVWTFRDIELRSRSVVTQIFSTLMVVLFFVPGVLLYLILRPKETLDEAFQRSLEEEYLLQDLEELPLCPACHRYVEDDFILCPHCHAQLREPCVSCSRLVELRWALCPYCGVVQHGRVEAGGRVETPAARWVAPQLRRRRTISEPTAPLPARAPAATDGTVAANGATQPRELQREATPLPRTASIVSGVRSVVRPFGRFRSRDTESDGSVGPEAEEFSVDEAFPAEFDHPLPNGRAVGDEARRFFYAMNGTTEQVGNGANGNGRGVNGNGTDGHAEVDDRQSTMDRLEPVAIPSWTDSDEESADVGVEFSVARTRQD